MPTGATLVFSGLGWPCATPPDPRRVAKLNLAFVPDPDRILSATRDADGSGRASSLLIWCLTGGRTFPAASLNLRRRFAWKEEAMSTTSYRQRITTQELDDLGWTWAVKLAEMDRKDYCHKQTQEQFRLGSQATETSTRRIGDGTLLASN